MPKGKMNPFGLNEAMVYVSTSWGLASDHRPSVQSVPLGLFCHESKAHDCSWLGRSGEGGWHLLSGLVVLLLRTVGELSLALFWNEETKVLSLVLQQAYEKDWAAVFCLHTLHLTHSLAELWPRFLRFALWGTWAPRVPACSPDCGHHGPQSSSLLPWRGCGPCGMRLGLSS